MNRAGHALQVILLASVCASGSALAAKLDRDTCAGLASELASLVATGIKADMERGSDWGRANMSTDRLLTAQRVLELEDQLEFRCGVRVNKPKEVPAMPVSAPPATIETRAKQAPASGPPSTPAAAVSGTAAAASRPATTKAKVPAATAPMALGAPAPMLPAAAAPVPPHVAGTARPPAAVSVGPTKSLPAPAAAVVVEPGAAKRVMAANPPPTAPVAAPAAAVPAMPPVTKLGPLPSVAAAVAPPPAAAPVAGAGLAPTPGAKKPLDPTALAARKKNQRRNSSSAYVAPTDVTPFSLPGMR